MRKRRFIFGGLALGVLGLVVSDRLFPPDLARYQQRSLELLDRDGKTLNLVTAADGMVRLPATQTEVDPRYLDLLLRTEDRRFWWHPGVDPLALLRAAGQVMTHGRVVSGGSTLTMQVARLLTPHRHTLLGKLIDIARALQLEERFDKHEILAMYLTLAPMGGNLEGVRAASLAYFQHGPAALSPEEAALLVALPQHPARLRPERHPFPAEAPHLTDRFRASGRSGAVRTTLDAGLQRAVEDLAAHERPFLGPEVNIAALVIANRDRQVLAYLGGADYFGPGGMVDMIHASRSPGSTLKPFIYGMAFDQALITPESVIEDEPIDIHSYAPQNFDRTFHGAITARRALQQSYNLPAIELMRALDPKRFALHLHNAGARFAFPHGIWAPTLPMALGGVGIDLNDLAMLYAALADGGRAAPLRLEPGAPPAKGVPLMSEDAAWEVSDILRGSPLPSGFVRSRPIAYKTGTSYGFRDALAIGSSPRFTVAVWVGRTEGTPRPGAYGRNTAAPLLFRIFDLLPPEDPSLPPPPRGVVLNAGTPRAAQLRRFAVSGTGAPSFQPVDEPRIIYPPSGARIELARIHDALAPLALEASGGTPPYRWVVNGVPLPPTPVGSHPTWQPDGPGFAHISVIDAQSRTATAEARVE